MLCSLNHCSSRARLATRYGRYGYRRILEMLLVAQWWIVRAVMPEACFQHDDQRIRKDCLGEGLPSGTPVTPLARFDRRQNTFESRWIGALKRLPVLPWTTEINGPQCWPIHDQDVAEPLPDVKRQQQRSGMVRTAAVTCYRGSRDAAVSATAPTRPRSSADRASDS